MRVSAASLAPRSRSLGDWLLNGRNRLVADPRFQRWASTFPLTRSIAQKRSRALFDLCAGFVYSQILVACVRLDLFRRLAKGSRPEQELAEELGLSVDMTRRLLCAADSLGLVRQAGQDRWALADLGAAMVGNPSIAAFCDHHALLYDDLRDPVALLRGETRTQLSQFWPYAGREPGDVRIEASAALDEQSARYSRLMSASQALIAEDVLDALGPLSADLWIDVGAGEGAFISAVAARLPTGRLVAFDLPNVAERAKVALAQRGLASRIEVQGGDFLCDSLPNGADVVSLVRVLHDHDDASASTLLRAACAALAPEGELVIAEPMAGTPGAEPVGDAYFGFYLLAMGGGRPRRPQDISRLLESAGFKRIRTVKTRRPLLTSVMTAVRA